MNAPRSFLVVFVVLLILSACGKKTVPVAPQTLVPQPITDLSAHLDEKGVTLYWSMPRYNENGTPLSDLDGFDIARAVVPEEDACDDCPLPFGMPVRVEAVIPLTPAESYIQYYTEALLRPHHRYYYQVRTVKKGWGVTSGPSNTVAFSWDTPLAAPRFLKALPGDRTITLQWSGPENLLDGSPAVGPFTYQVYRGTDGSQINRLGSSIAQTSYQDTEVQNGRRYFYQVRAIRIWQNTELPGAASTMAEGIPVDLTPPAPPRNLEAIKTSAGIKLVWEKGLEKDLQGYRVYRRVESREDGILIAEVPAPTSQFVDSGPLPGQENLYYSVTAIDTATPANESSRSIEAVLELVR